MNRLPLMASALSLLTNPFERWSERMRSRPPVREVCLVLLNLMQDLQLHRGLSGAVLDKRSEFGEELTQTQQKLGRSLHALADEYGDRHPVFRQEKWHDVLTKWESLQGHWRDLDFYTNLFAHSALIMGLIDILRTIADAQQTKLGERRANILREWPGLIEQLGLLRALGLHALSHHDGETDERVPQSIENYLSSARTALHRIAHSVTDPSMVDASEGILKKIQSTLSGGARPEAPQHYCDEMTALINKWYRQIEIELLQQTAR